EGRPSACAKPEPQQATSRSVTAKKRVRRINGTSYDLADESERRGAAIAPEPANAEPATPARAALPARIASAAAAVLTVAITGRKSTAPPETIPVTRPRNSNSM